MNFSVKISSEKLRSEKISKESVIFQGNASKAVILLMEDHCEK
jgi:hypothetical protein